MLVGHAFNEMGYGARWTGPLAGRSARWSASMRQRLLDQQIMVSRPLHHGRHHIKVVLGNPHTSDALIDRLGALLNDTSEEGL